MKELKMKEEKQKEFIYCTFIVILLIILLLGDQIALHFIAKNPNPNNAVFGGMEKEEYKIDFLEELSLKEVLEKIKKEQKFLLLSTRENCETCKIYLTDLKQVIEEYQIKGYYINYDLVDLESKEYLEFLKFHESLSTNFTYTPYLIYFENGLFVSDAVGRLEQNELEDFIIKNKIA